MKRFLFLLLFAAPALAQRSLYWDSIHVKARLDAQGALHVREEQSYVFDGDWNGGERIVRVPKGQRFEFVNLSRVDKATGELVPLSYGSIDVVDGYVVVDDSKIRWRSRLPSDPPFRDERITYVLEYRLFNALLRRFSTYHLNHDFIFPERPGEIRQLTVDLELDPAWHSEALQRQYRAGPIPAGSSYVVKGALEFRGTGPAPEARLDTLPFRLGMAVLLVVLPIVFWQTLLRREEKLGRFAPVPTPLVSPRWIEEQLVPIPAEVAGAAWDEDVETHEVSALIARWVGEGKVKSTASSSNLSLELIAPRESFEGYESELIEKLFFDGDKTSTSKIREHYESSGFNPTRIVKKGLLHRAGELAQLSEKAPLRGGVATAIFFVVALRYLWIAWRDNPDHHVAIVVTAVVMGLILLIGSAMATMWRGRIDQGHAELKPIRITMTIILVAAIVIVLLNLFTFEAQIGFTALALMIASRIVNSAKSVRGASAIAFRKRLAAARLYFTQELSREDPGIDDRWFPWIIAFGLDKEATKWAEGFGVHERRRSHSSGISSMSSSSSSSSSSDSRPSWSGGGGAFGGAGATGTWAVAASGLAAGVAPPSSSSSGGSSSGGSSGGGGGSSSGGGSGGGW